MVDSFYEDFDEDFEEIFGPSDKGSEVEPTLSPVPSYMQNPDESITWRVLYTPQIAERAKNVVKLLGDFRIWLCGRRNINVPADDSTIIKICEGCINLFNQAANLNGVNIDQNLFAENNIPVLSNRNTTREIIAYNSNFSPSLFNNNTFGLILSALLTATATENELEFALRSTEREEVGQLTDNNTKITQEANSDAINNIQKLLSQFLKYLM